MVVRDETHFQYVLSALGIQQTPPPSGASSLTTGASSGAAGSEKLPSLISHVKDILPHLGDRFIEVRREILCVDPWGAGVLKYGKRIPGIKSMNGPLENEGRGNCVLTPGE